MGGPLCIIGGALTLLGFLIAMIVTAILVLNLLVHFATGVLLTVLVLLFGAALLSPGSSSSVGSSRRLLT